MTASCSQWLLEPYGAPTSTSEVNCITGFYCVEALTAFGPAREPLAQLAGEVSDAVERAVESAVESLAEIASAAVPGSVRPAL
jgi:hypothetical protein